MKDYLTGDYEYKIITGPGQVFSFSDYSNDKNMDVIDLETLFYAIQEDFDATMDERGLAEYCDEEKIVSIHPPIPCDSKGKINYSSSAESDEPYLLWTVYTSSFLDRNEEKRLKDYIEGQCSDGWGEGFEQQVLYSYSEEEEEWVEDEDPETGEVEEYRDYITSNFDVYYSPWDSGNNWKIEILNKKSVRESSKLKNNRNNNVFEIQEEIVINQEDQRIILEKGDKISVLEKSVQVKNPELSDIYDSLSDGLLVYWYSGLNQDALAFTLIESNRVIDEKKFYINDFNMNKINEFINSNYSGRTIYNATRYLWSVFSDQWVDKKDYIKISDSIPFVWDYTIKAYKEYKLEKLVNYIKNDNSVFDGLSFLSHKGMLSNLNVSTDILKKYKELDLNQMEVGNIYLIKGNDYMHRTDFFLGENLDTGKGFMGRERIMKGFGFGSFSEGSFVKEGNFLLSDFFSFIQTIYEVPSRDYELYSQEIEEFIELNVDRTYKDLVTTEKLYDE